VVTVVSPKTTMQTHVNGNKSGKFGRNRGTTQPLGMYLGLKVRRVRYPIGDELKAIYADSINVNREDKKNGLVFSTGKRRKIAFKTRSSPIVVPDDTTVVSTQNDATAEWKLAMNKELDEATRLVSLQKFLRVVKRLGRGSIRKSIQLSMSPLKYYSNDINANIWNCAHRLQRYYGKGNDKVHPPEHNMKQNLSNLLKDLDKDPVEKVPFQFKKPIIKYVEKSILRLPKTSVSLEDSLNRISPPVEHFGEYDENIDNNLEEIQDEFEVPSPSQQKSRDDRAKSKREKETQRNIEDGIWLYRKHEKPRITPKDNTKKEVKKDKPKSKGDKKYKPQPPPKPIQSSKKSMFWSRHTCIIQSFGNLLEGKKKWSVLLQYYISFNPYLHSTSPFA
jgi:hypothetical protein